MQSKQYFTKIKNYPHEKSTEPLFVLGLSIGSNSLIINNIGKFGWQAIVLATLSILGSLLASFLVFHLFFKKGGNE